LLIGTATLKYCALPAARRNSGLACRAALGSGSLGDLLPCRHCPLDAFEQRRRGEGLADEIIGANLLRLLQVLERRACGQEGERRRDAGLANEVAEVVAALEADFDVEQDHARRSGLEGPHPFADIAGGDDLPAGMAEDALDQLQD